MSASAGKRKSRLSRGRAPVVPEVVDLVSEEEDVVVNVEEEDDVMIVEEMAKIKISSNDDNIQVDGRQGAGGNLRKGSQDHVLGGLKKVFSQRNLELSGCCSTSLKKGEVNPEANVTGPLVKDGTIPGSNKNLEPEMDSKGSVVPEQSDPKRSDNNGNEMMVELMDLSSNFSSPQNQKVTDHDHSVASAIRSDELGAVGGSSQDHSQPPPSPEASSENNGREEEEEDRRLVYMSEPTLHLEDWTDHELDVCEAAILKRLAQLAARPGIFENYKARYPPFPPSDPYPSQMLEQDENGKLTWLMCRKARQRKKDEEDVAAGRNKWGFKLPPGPTLTFAEVICSDLPDGSLPACATNSVPDLNPSVRANLDALLVQGEEMLRRKPLVNLQDSAEASPNSSRNTSSSSTSSSGKCSFKMPSYVTWLFMTEDEKKKALEEYRKNFHEFLDEKRRQETKEKAAIRKRTRSKEKPPSLIIHGEKGVKWQKTRIGVGVITRKPVAKKDLFPENVLSEEMEGETLCEEDLDVSENVEASCSETHERLNELHEPSATVSMDQETQGQPDDVISVSISSEIHTTSPQSGPVVPPEVSMPKPPGLRSLAQCPIEDNTGWVQGDVWEVEKIVDSHYSKGSAGNERIVYKVKWRGWNQSFNSWLDEADVSKPLVKEYWRKLAKKIKELNAPILKLAQSLDPETSPDEYSETFGKSK